MIPRSSFGRLARTVFIRSRYFVTVKTFVWNWCLSVAIQQQASAASQAGAKTFECIGWRRLAMIDYKVNSNSGLDSVSHQPSQQILQHVSEHAWAGALAPISHGAA